MNNILKISSALSLLTVMVSCETKPKVIQASLVEKKSTTIQNTSGIFYTDEPLIDLKPKKKDVGASFHQVTALETLETSKYVYVKVSEAGEQYWVATNKMPVAIGETYFYSSGLLKQNFRSKEHDRVFEKLYLIPSLVKENHGVSKRPAIAQKTAPKNTKSYSHEDLSDLVAIKDLVENPDQFSGKVIKIKGVCTKVNSKILGRNWIHLKDGSLDSYDLVVTSRQVVQVGNEMVVSGKVTLKKDFGSGYYYDILIEEGEISQDS